MNKSYAKIKHIQEANMLLEKRLLKEQAPPPQPNPVPNPAPIQQNKPKTQLVGKTVALHNDLQTAQNAKQNPNSPMPIGSMKVRIVRVEPGSNDVTLIVTLEGDNKEKNLVWVREWGAFQLQNTGESYGPKYYNETLKDVLENEYMVADFASKSKTGTQTNV